MSGLLGPKPQSTVDKRLNGMEINQSAYGSPIALNYGKTRVPMTLGWYGDFTATPHTTKQPGGKGGAKSGTNTTFSYSAAVVMLLGEGQVGGVGTVWNDKAQVTLADLGLTLFDGTGGQAPWSYLTTNHPAEAIGYDHTAYVANGAFQLGGSASLPNLTFELKGLKPYNPGTIDDASPAEILVDYCTDANHGCGFPYLGTLIGGGTATYEAYVVAMGMFISPSERTQRSAADFIAEILKVTNSECVWSAGVLKVVPRADASVTGNGRTYTPDLTPKYTFTDDDFLYEDGEDPVRVTRKAPSERFNVVRVEYLDRSNQYNTAVAEAKDANDIALNGERAAPIVNLHCIQTTSLARRVAQLLLQQQLFIVNTYDFKVRADYSLLEPLDYVGITDSGLGLSNQLVRITETDDSDEDEFSITAEEVLVGTASAPLYNWQGAAGYAANYNASPGSVSAPVIFNAPPLLVGYGGGYELWMAVSGAGGLWGGCDVYMSLDNASYAYVGSIAGPARHGTLTATLASSGAPLDTVNTLSVQLARTELALGSGNAVDRDENRLLMWVDGEILSYQTATLTGAGAYNVTSMRRGQYGSAISSHASGTKFARIDAALFRLPYDAGMIGRTAYFKFVSFNVYGGGYETLAGATVYSKVLNAINIGQALPGTLTLIGNGVTVVGNDAFKSGGVSAWDASCYSKESYLNGAFASFRPTSTSTQVMVGLNTDPTTDSDYTSIDYALYCYAVGNLGAYESGVNAGFLGTFAVGDDLSVTYDGSIVRYLKNGVVLREVMAGSGKRFYLDSSFVDPGTAIQAVRFGPYGTAQPVMFNARGNCVVSDTHVGKVGGAAAWDSDVYSLAGYPTCHVSFKANQANMALMVGLSVTPVTSLSYTGIAYALYPNDGGNLQIYESGVFVGTYGTYTTKTLFAITYDGATVTYWKDGVSIRTVSVAGLLLYMDSSFYNVGAGINSLRWGPTTSLDVIDTYQISPGAVTEAFVSTDAGPLDVVVNAPAVASGAIQLKYITVPFFDAGEEIRIEASFRVGTVGPPGAFTVVVYAFRANSVGSATQVAGQKITLTQNDYYPCTVIGRYIDPSFSNSGRIFGLAVEVTGDGVNNFTATVRDLTLRVLRVKR